MKRYFSFFGILFMFSLMLGTLPKEFESVLSKSSVGDFDLAYFNMDADIPKMYRIDKGGNVVYLSKQDIKRILERDLFDEKNNKVDIVNVEVIVYFDKDDFNKEYYMLRGNNKDNTVKVGMVITKTKEGFLISNKKCTCKGCPNGCNLRHFGDDCSCSACFGDSSAGCTKSEEMEVPGDR
ncbi:hypothetical protein J5295_01570 [Riemerella anatipestifer]|uniref:Uncharacterized protein n=1 Tax=Riemerella anatipestifer TaxID=34085 RepID=A0AAP3AM86_RIEAN|nr:hypothetical protein [Riemerella anatipestifer]AZZ59663.1 hypothetical protein AWB57_11910 [Riemerella anatipestifer]MBT0525480.1 hypothetical protein [Riemerella anatipestifer]MBT0527323.1 hypothetical protein [Riemerella anatipestifer]MBT0529364.1 hypothetical protein [Riemerella anatipestifer]MBT0531165.1 hypothetical protein [Riemerella anatipestifer]